MAIPRPVCVWAEKATSMQTSYSYQLVDNYIITSSM